MTDFRPASIDWESVRLLHGEHLRGETGYVEELVRWMLRGAAGAGVVHMDPDSLSLVSSSPSTYRLTLRRFQVLTPAGYWVSVGDDEFNPTLDLDRQQYLESVVAVSIGVDTRAKDSRALKPSQSSALAECRSLWPRYVLGSSDTIDGCDCLKITEIANVRGELALNAEFIPDCVSLASHPRLVRAVQEIGGLANDGLEALLKVSESAREVASQFAAALAPASTLVDWRVRPHAYIERMVGVLQASKMVATLRQRDNPHRDDAIRLIDSALEYAHGADAHGPWLGPALQKIADALRKLLELYPQVMTEQVRTVAEPKKPFGDTASRVIKRAP